MNNNDEITKNKNNTEKGTYNLGITIEKLKQLKHLQLDLSYKIIKN